MKTMESYIKMCKFPDENDSYLSLMRSVKTLYVRMCKTGSFQTSNIYNKMTVKMKEFDHVSLVTKLYVIHFLS
jgi:hypothetical protein